MCLANISNKVLFEKEGVFIHTTVVQADEDALVAGKVQLIEKPEGVFLEWHASEEEYYVKGTSEAEWTVVESVSYKNDKEQNSIDLSPKPSKKPPMRHKYIINFDLKDLKSFKRSKPNLGWSYLIFILKCGSTCPALHFHQGGTKLLMKELDKHLHVRKSPNDSCLYLVREHDPQALSRSFDELQLFEQQSNDVLSKFIRDPYTTTLGGFSKVTKFLNDTFMTVEGMERHKGDLAADILHEDIEGMDINTQEEPGFEMITRTELPPRPAVKRSPPLTPGQWSCHMDQDGKVIDVDKLKQIIFRGGVDPTVRIEVWKYLLGYYSWDSTYKTRTEQRKKKVDDYFRMKLQWKSVTEEQERRFSTLRDRKNLIEKDVTRTDRTHPFFEGDDNPNIQVLYDILMTYCMYNFDLGYVQGMSDLLAPILVIMENEVDAFWCLAGYMERVGDNFEMQQEGMKKQLRELHLLVKFVDPQLCNYLESHDSDNMYFCFRWLLILFKREFAFTQVMRLWEVIWTDIPCKNFHLLICLAILDTEKTLLIDNNFGFTEILKHINDISGSIDLEHTLRQAEGLFLQLSTCRNLASSVREILDMPHDALNGALDGSASNLSSVNGGFTTSPTTPESVRRILPHSHTNGEPASPDDGSSIEILAEQNDLFL